MNAAGWLRLPGGSPADWRWWRGVAAEGNLADMRFHPTAGDDAAGRRRAPYRLPERREGPDPRERPLIRCAVKSLKATLVPDAVRGENARQVAFPG